MSAKYDRAEIAYNYVNRTAGNKKYALEMYLSEHGIEPTDNTRKMAYFIAQEDEFKQYVEQFRAENRANNEHLKEQLIETLKDIVADPDTLKKDKIAAAKELSNMHGFNQQNINMNANVDAEIEIILE